MLKIKKISVCRMVCCQIEATCLLGMRSLVGGDMNHRLSGIISIEHSIFRNWTMQSGWVISRLAGCTNRASNYLHYICKRSSTSEQAIICFGVRTENKTHVLPARM